MAWIIAFLFGASFRIFLSIFIDRFLDKQFDNERKQMEFKIEKVTWLSKNDKE
ncbi:TPA: hypothetical protein ACGW65_003333 [Bacillus paranthracis]